MKSTVMTQCATFDLATFNFETSDLVIASCDILASRELHGFMIVKFGTK
jgi:hypothetical protein